MVLSIHGAEPTNVFRLIGSDENSASFAVGWALERSPNYRNLVIEAVFGEVLDIDDAVIQLQKHGQDGGFTDIEMQAGHLFHVILEAKRAWELPTVEQLTRYLPRLIAGGAERKRLISVSARIDPMRGAGCQRNSAVLPSIICLGAICKPWRERQKR